MFFRRAYSLNISDPCHQSWRQMQPAEQGRYCGHCSKVVTDFTGKTEKEIADFFKSRPQQVCGRFRQAQLHKTYTAPAVLMPPVHRRLSKYLLGLMLTGAAVEKAKAQEPVEQVLQKDSLAADSASALVSAVPPDSLDLACDTMASPADSLPALHLKIDLEWKPGICISTGTYVIGPEIMVLGAIAMMPPERRNPLDYLLDSLELMARKMRLKRAAGKTYPIAASAADIESRPHNRKNAPLRLPAQEAILPAASGWKPKKNGRVKST